MIDYAREVPRLNADGSVVISKPTTNEDVHSDDVLTLQPGDDLYTEARKFAEKHKQLLIASGLLEDDNEDL